MLSSIEIHRRNDGGYDVRHHDKKRYLNVPCDSTLEDVKLSDVFKMVEDILGNKDE